MKKRVEPKSKRSNFNLNNYNNRNNNCNNNDRLIILLLVVVIVIGLINLVYYFASFSADSAPKKTEDKPSVQGVISLQILNPPPEDSLSSQENGSE